ncbi:LRR domain containing protein [Parasponia andersonii]|uniref:LRR domain containing protein n=1 Tax=Parasponia andersonii TaxID=3476 RepID=A0A2P5BB52_PARAD|nr:LRR domain containing protein [Parasponia andersonii]
MEYYNIGDVQTIKVEATNLHSFVCYGSIVQTIRVEAAKLHSFVCGVTGLRNVNLIGCAGIRNLSFSTACLAGQWFEDLIPKLPLLESLKLDCCYGVKDIKIRNQQIKYLDLNCRVD